MIALKLSKISKSFGPTIALDGVDLELREGEVHALIGENGAGKSTLMNVIAGSLQPDQGSMEVNGQPYSPSNPLDARTRGIALIHQELSLCPHLSVAENVLMGIESSHLGWLDRDNLINASAICQSRRAKSSRSRAHSQPVRASFSWTSPPAVCNEKTSSSCSR
jgi:ABC-type sugar transport system ATPase subunit